MSFQVVDLRSATSKQVDEKRMNDAKAKTLENALQQKCQKIDKIAFILFALCLLIFNSIYFPYYILWKRWLITITLNISYIFVT